MELSAEIRWFWNDKVPDRLKEWFCDSKSHGIPAGGGKPRTDEYLRDRLQDELGIKKRGGEEKVQVKGLVAILPSQLVAGPFAGEIEIWCKWESKSLELEPKDLISVEKTRWLRKFDTTGNELIEVPLDEDEKPIGQRMKPERGCNIELTKIELSEGAIWWTLGFESFGKLDTVEPDLHGTAKLLATRQPPNLAGGISQSYPVWLRGIMAGDTLPVDVSM